MKNILFILFLAIFSAAKSQEVESIIQQAEIEKNDSIRCTLLTKVSYEWAIDKPKVALDFGLRAKEIAERLKNKLLQQRAYDVIAQSYDGAKEFKNSRVYFRKALAVNAQLNDKPFLGTIYNNYALSFYYQSDIDSSLYYHFKALEIRKQINDKKAISSSYTNIGLIYRIKKDYPTALKFYNQSLVIKKEIGDKRGEFTTLNNIGALYKNLKKYDSAYSIFSSLMQIAENAGAYPAYASSANNKALCLNSMKRYEEAITVLEKLYNDERIKNVKDVYPLVVFGLGEANAGLRKYKTAFNYLQRALDMNFVGSDLEYKAEINRLLAVMAEENENYAVALRHYKLYRTYFDSLYNLANIYNINELTAKYESAQKEQRIALLNKENELKDARLKEKEKSYLLLQTIEEQRLQEYELLNKENQIQQLSIKEKQQSLQLSDAKLKENEQQINLLNKEKEVNKLLLREKQKQNWLTLFALLIAIAFAIGAFLSFRNKKKANAQLGDKNLIIQKSLEDKEILLKEIHHRVKNNLQVVSSLLNLQSRNIQDPTALAAIKEGRDRVKSMALIHQNLYDDDNLMGVDVKDYIEKLVQSLFTSYNIQEEKIKLRTEIDDLNLDVDSVVPIGLILTELISNSLKYAFDEEKIDGELMIKLKQEKGNLLLQVKDNGKGLQADWSYEKTTSLGYQLIRSFAAKMKAMLTVNGTNGTDVQMIITKYKLTS